MQVFFMDHAIDADRISVYHANQLKSKTFKLMQEILTGTFVKADDREKLLKKIIFDIIVNSMLGNPTNSKVLI